MAGVVVNDQVATVRERHGIGAGIRIRQIGCRERNPRLATALRPSLTHHDLLRASQQLHRAVLVQQQTWLNRLEALLQYLRLGIGLPGRHPWLQPTI